MDLPYASMFTMTDTHSVLCYCKHGI